MNIGSFADLRDNLSFPITLQMNDLINPTTIKTSYSKTISLPRTPTNDKIFSEYFKLDKLVDLGSFSALEKTPFTLYHNGSEVLFDGWIKLNTITNDSYEINLMNFENKLFSELSDLKLNQIDLDLTHRIGRYYIWNSWNSDEGLYGILKYAPTYQGQYLNFTSNLKLNSSGSSTVELPNTIDEYQKGELRSYYQKPSIKVSEIIKSICTSHNIELAINDEFFTTNNPYWEKLFMVIPKYYNVSKETSIFKPTYRSDQAGRGQIITNSLGYLTTNTVGRCHSTKIADEFDMEHSYRLDLSKYPSGTLEVHWEFDIEIEAALSQEIVNAQNELEYKQYVTPTYYTSTAYPDNGSSRLAIRSYIVGQNNAYSNTYLRYGNYYSFSQYQENYNELMDTLYLEIPTTYTIDNYQKFRFLSTNAPNYQDFGQGIQDIWYSALPSTTKVSGTSIINNDGTDAYISFTLNGYNAATNQYTTPAFRLINSVWLPNYLAPFYKNTKLRFRVIENENLRITVKPYSGQVRSNHKLTIDNLLDPEITQAEFLVNYMKLFGLVIYYNKQYQKYILCSRNKFYSNYSIIDWTYKVIPDTMSITPTPIDSRIYKLKWDDIQSTHYVQYNKVFGQEYGSVLIDSNNQLFDNTTELLNSYFATPLIEQSYNFDSYNTQYRLPYKALSMCTYSNTTRTAAIPNKPTLVFWNGIDTLPISTIDSRPNWLILSDDTYLMREKNEYFWSTDVQMGETQDSSLKCILNNQLVFPNFCTVIDKVASLDFSVPKVTFFELDNPLTDNISIYNRFFEKYLNDRYSIHNRILEVEVSLTNSDIANFSFSNLYLIKNTLYVVSKIIDYNPVNEKPTKVQLIRVLDIANYTNGQSIIINDYISKLSIGLPTITYDGTENANVSFNYVVPTPALVTSKGLVINNVKIEDTESTGSSVSIDVTRPYASNTLKVTPYIVYNNFEYFYEEITITFPEYTFEITDFNVTQNGDYLDISFSYTTNSTIIEQGMYINGVKHIVSGTASPIELTIIEDDYQVVAYIILPNYTILSSDTYIVR